MSRREIGGFREVLQMARRQQMTCRRHGWRGYSVDAVMLAGCAVLAWVRRAYS